MQDAQPPHDGAQHRPSAFQRSIFGYRPRDVDRYVGGIERTVVALVDQVASAQMQLQGVTGELAAREIREQELIARAERREREACERLEAADRDARRLTSEAEVRASEIIAGAQRAARHQTVGVTDDVAGLRREAARLVELQAAVNATLGAVVGQVTSTLELLQEERAGSGAGSGAGAGAAVTASCDEGVAPAPQGSARTTTPRPLTPQRMPEPAGVLPRDPESSPPAVNTTIEIHGVALYAEIGAIERALAHMSHVQDVHVSTYVDGHAVLQVRQSRSTPLVDQLRAELAATWDVESPDGPGSVVIRHAEPADPRT